MLWPGISIWLNCLLLAATVGPPGSLADDGNVGCLFSERLCAAEEWCYNDFAFGRCMPAAGDVEEDDLFRYDLERESLHELSGELRRLFTLGYRWSHAYTQCRLQAMLYAFKNEMSFEPDACTHLVDQDLEGALKALEGQAPLEPQQVAIIKYTPSVDNPQSDFADEVYFPPEDERERQELRERILGQGAIDIEDMADPYADYQVIKRSWVPQMHRRSVNPQLFSEQYNTPSNFRMGKETRDAVEFLDDPSALLNQNSYLTLEEMTEMYPIIKYLNDMNLTPNQIAKFLTAENYERLGEMLQEYEVEEEPDERFTLQYNTPDNFRAGWESRDSLQFDNELPESRIYIDEEVEPMSEEYGSGNSNEEIFRERKTNLDSDEIFRELRTLQDMQSERFNEHWGKGDQKEGLYTEGGVVYAREKSLKNRLNQILDDLKFERRERLDVKKPGPPFTVNAKATINKDGTIFIPNMMKKEPRNPNMNPAFDQREVEEADHVYITFKNSFSNWKQGDDLIHNISTLLHLEHQAFVEGRVEPDSINFKVDPNSKDLNASEVAKKIGLIKDDLKELTGDEITSIGIGGKYQMETVIMSHVSNENQFYIVLFMVCGVLAAMIVATTVLILIKRHIKSRDKLMQLSRPDTEASKDYQDLCRTQMATKNQQSAGGNDTVHGRITSLSRESEQSPSSRSSTSSWSEEPALHNMDISTGHMVLSYMEDHLKNKDRLEQEWVALCAYVAEPCETTIALKKDNVEKNRYKEIIPYDHARVVLNELSNANGNDYINASSITDHDPRNPAYIATQGPLPHTAPDFWQLIWEQGAVVIVMLSRLTEGGTAMCHRYWPEEGSELYHIYEVHLVSEHIWCDDYLVRSFYLKNVKTGETRTVTQFHFLSWVEAGVPASTKALLEFRRKVNKSYRGRSCPIVVHCSDGAGRTGTYCLIDMVLSRMAKGAKEIDIAATLEHLRDQRPRMVATKQQFEFVLTAVAEEVHAILKTLPPQPATTQASTTDNQKEKQ